MSSTELATTAPAVNNPVNSSAQSGPRLYWRRRADDDYYHWASAAKGRYVVQFIFGGDAWNVDHRRGPGGKKCRQLGVADTIAAAKAIAEADYQQQH